MAVIGFVPARGGSKRIIRKNLATVGGVPLVVRAIRCAWDAGCDRVVVSTDDGEIAAIAQAERAEIEPSFRHTDTTQIEEAIGHWMRRCSPVLADDDVIVMLQPTTPLRRPETVRLCVDLVRSGYDSAHATHLDRREPFRGNRCHVIDPEEPQVVRVIWDRPHGWVRRRSQDIRYTPEETGGCYAFTAGHFRRTRSRMGGDEAAVCVDWIEALDIDTPADLELARVIEPHVERLREAT